MKYHLLIKNYRIAKLIIVISLITLLGSCNKNTKAYDENTAIYFIEYGVLFKVIVPQNQIKIVGFFNPAAPTVVRDSNGYFWARMSNREIAVMNPKNGKIIKRIMLSYKPYNHIIIPNGKIYITHNTLTKNGFTLSVINSKKKKILEVIKGIKGIRTGITYCKEKVYLATMGIGKDKYLHLYEINSKDDNFKELKYERIVDYVWILGASNNKVFIFRSKSLNNKNQLIMYVLNPLNDTINKNVIKIDYKIKRVNGTPFYKGNSIYIPVILENNRGAIIEINVNTFKVKNVFRLKGSIYKIVGIKNDVLFYIRRALCLQLFLRMNRD